MLDSILLLFNLGTGEIIVIVLVILLLFGGKKIPELMKGVGKVDNQVTFVFSFCKMPDYCRFSHSSRPLNQQCCFACRLALPLKHFIIYFSLKNSFFHTNFLIFYKNTKNQLDTKDFLQKIPISARFEMAKMPISARFKMAKKPISARFEISRKGRVVCVRD